MIRAGAMGVRLSYPAELSKNDKIILTNDVNGGILSPR